MYARKSRHKILASVLAALLCAGCNMENRSVNPNLEARAATAEVTPIARANQVAAEDQTEVAESSPAVASPMSAAASTVAQTLASPQPAQASAESGGAETLASSHRVVAGDTLTRIAERYGVSVASLLTANDLTDPDLLYPGQIITLPLPPVDYSPAFLILPDSRLARSLGAENFDIQAFLEARGGALSGMTSAVTSRRPDGNVSSESYTAAQIIQRVSNEYSVDARILIAFLEHFAGLASQTADDAQAELYPLLPPDQNSRLDRAGLYAQLSWLADRLNQGYYGWKYRSQSILELPDGSRQNFAANLNAGTVAVQHALAQMPQGADWQIASGEEGIYRSYTELFGDPFVDAFETVPANLEQPELTLPFPPGVAWRFTGGFHGGWGNGSAWAAVDFSPPAESGQGGACYISSHPVTAVARGSIARLDEGVVVLDLDGDSQESSGWTILYLHVDSHDSLAPGQWVEAGNIIGYPSCLGGFTTATHLHIARRYNGEWLPADCNRCPAKVNAPPFVMSGWKVVGLESQLYQGFLINELDSRSVVAEQGRFTSINEISW